MPLTPVSLGVRSNPGRHGADSAARLINCEAEDAGEEGKIRWPIYASHGFDTFASLAGSGAIRGMLALSSSAMYAVAGRVVYKVTSAAVVTPLGGFETDGAVFMARNRASPAQIGLVSGGVFYRIQSDTLTQISDVDLPTPTSITAIDGYFVFTIEDGRFFITAIDDTTIDALDFSSAAANPDGLMVGATRGRELVLFGPQSIEFWVNTGAADFPFEISQSVNIGCYAAGSVREVTIIGGGNNATDSIAFAATDAEGAYAGVMILNGYSGTKVSTPAVDRDIQAETDPTVITSGTWSWGGNTYYAIIGTDFTWVYNFATGFWHERESYGLSRWRVAQITTFGTQIIYGDYATGTLYQLDSDTYTEAGRPLVATIQPPAVHAWPKPMVFHAIYIDVIPGVGINSTNDADANPQIMVAASNDNGKNFGAERMASIGAIGKFKTRVKLTRFGQSGEDGKVFRISCSAAVVKGITGFAVDAVAVAKA